MGIIKNYQPKTGAANNLHRKNFTSKWEYTQAISNWHFDPWKIETPPPFKVFMRIEGDWKKWLQELEYEIKVSTLNYGFKGTDHDNIIENDFLNWGYSKEMIQYDRTYKVPQPLRRVGEQLHLKHPDIRIHRQMPGMVAPIHIDTYCSHPAMDKNPELDISDCRRFVIQLTDWDWGHFWSFGNSPWQQWKAGEVAYFESRDVIHCTANAGKSPRLTMTVTGWLTEKTRELVEGDFKVIHLDS